MRSIRLAACLLFLAPAAAYGGTATLVTRELPAGAGDVRTRTPFDLVGVQWRGSGTVSFRTLSARGRWGPWRPAAPEAEDQPDPGSPELRRPRWRNGNPYWTGPSSRLQVRSRGRVSRVRVHFVRSPGDGVPLRSLSTAGSPLILSRLAWGANERIRRGRTEYADAVRFAIVHHTAGSNTYTRAQAAGIVRGIQRYHVLSNGWNDIGYNFLIDKYGQIFEGRYGGVDRTVIGAHAQGFNKGSFGVALIGSYGSSGVTPAARTALTRLLAWRLDVAHVDPLTLFSWISDGNPRFPAGVPVTLRTVSGHRDTGFTSCPGTRLYSELNTLARAVAQLGLPKLYFPRVTGAPGGPVRFTAQLSEPGPWSVLVTDAGGALVASGEGESASIDWTWDARTVPAGRYSYAIEAGANTRAATGVIAGTPPQGTLTALARPALITPNGDGRTESTTVRYRLRSAATVTATVVDANGAPLTTLFTAERIPGTFEFRWNGAGLPDGRYGIVLTARNAFGVETTATVAVIVDRALSSLRVIPSIFSPNGDGRWDTILFRFFLNAPARVSISVRRGTTGIGEVFAGRLEAGSQSIPWNGRFRRRVGEREYNGLVRATSAVATVSQTVPFAVDVTPPRLRLLSAATLQFTINEPATVTLVLDETRTIVVRRLAPGRFRISGGGAFSQLRATARDFAGNETAPLLYP